jgi:polysaccharide chain length determinant protein (PEP-CTERM system associated)
MSGASAELQVIKKVGRQAWRLAWVVFGIQVAATAAGVASLRVIPKQYSSKTTIRVEKSQLINPLTRGAAVSSDMDNRVRSIREELLSRDYFEKVIHRLGLERAGVTPIQHEGRVQEMIRNTEITTRQGEADTFQITYVGGDPQEVRDVTNLLAGIFIEESLSNKSDEAGSAVEFLQGQLEIYRKKLEEAETALRQFEEKHVDQVPATRAAQLARVEQMRATLLDIQNSLRQAELRRETLNQRLTGRVSPATGTAGEALIVPNPVQGQIQEKEAQLRRLLVDYSESFPDVVALRGEIEQLKKELAAHPTVSAAQGATAAGANAQQVQDALAYGQLQQLDVEIKSLATREEQLRRELARGESKVQGIPEVEQELARLRRDYEVNNDIYNNFLRRLEEARVSKELESSKRGEVFRILQAAALPLTPFRPTPLQTTLGGVGAGVALNLLLLFVLAQQDTSFQSPEEVRAALGVKVLAGFPQHESSRESTAARVKSLALGVVAAAYAAGVVALLYGQRIAALLRRGG